MITQLKAQTRNAYSGAVMRSLLFAMSGNEYVVKNIDGLGPVKSELVTMDVSTEPGRLLMSARDVQRNIVMTIGFSPNFGSGSDFSALRQKLYSVLVPSTIVELIFTDSVLGEMTISGVVESHEPTVFSEEPEVQISVLCSNPYFKSTAGLQTVSVASHTKNFEIDYPGDIPVGFIFEFDVDVATNLLRLENLPYANKGYFGLSFNFLVNDHVRVSTIPGDRRAEYIRSSALTNALGYLSGSLTKTKLTPGINYFNMVGYLSMNNPVLKYERLYGGL